MRLPVFLCFAPQAVLGSYLPWLNFQRLIPWYASAILNDVKVPVQLGVMSRCPDAILCENVFNDVLKKVADKVDLSLVYIAKVDPSEPDFGAKCLHGPQECAGNIQQLCVAKYQPVSVWWDFVQCQNNEGRQKIGDPDLALKCAKRVGFDWGTSEVGHCGDREGSGKGVEGVALLKMSIGLGQNLGIVKSCSILINRRKVCVHDGTWKECENGHGVNDFVRQINDEYDQLNKNSSRQTLSM